MNNFLFKKETYEIIGICMEVHRILGHGFNELVYKDAVLHEARLKAIETETEKEFYIEYKNEKLPHSFIVGLVFFSNIIVEIKAADNAINENAIAQTLNYLRASGCRVGMIFNFGKKSLEYKRLIF